jgi:hypothetical protein
LRAENHRYIHHHSTDALGQAVRHCGDDEAGLAVTHQANPLKAFEGDDVGDVVNVGLQDFAAPPTDRT